MAYATAKQIAASDIPVVDVAPLADRGSEGVAAVAAELRRAAETVGFFYIRNHGIPQEQIDRVLALARTFFLSPMEQKQLARINARHRGFLSVGQAKMPGEPHPDLKESFVWGLEVPEDDQDALAGNPMIGPNNWPAFLPAMADCFNAYYTAANECGRRLLQAFAVSLDLEPDHFVRSFEKPISRASVVYYPPQPPDLGIDRFGVGPHTDYGCLTLVHQDSVGGLQVRGRDGDWIGARPIEGTLVVNVGDLLARWTNDRFASTPHRVVNTSGRERFSLAVFVDPDWATLIEPVVPPGGSPHYASVRCGDYIQGRYDQSFAYRGREGD